MSTQVGLFQNERGVGPSSKFAPLVQAGIGNDLGEGIGGSYAILSIKGSRFGIKHRGETNIIMAPPQVAGAPPSPVSYIDIVIVKANPFLNKQWYKGAYVEGSTEQPDCYSLDGVAPSAAANVPQAPTCALCPKNQWGSKIGDDGQKQKACRDTKKLAIVPRADIPNATLGGAMLFRVPPASLKDLSTMADKLKGRGYPYNSVAVRLTFDTTVSHPKVLFQAIEPLNDTEADQVIALFNADSTDRVLSDGDAVVADPEVVRPQVQQPTPVAMPQAQQQAPNPPGMVPPGMVAVTPFVPNAAPPVPSATQFAPPVQPQGTLFLAPEQPEALPAKAPPEANSRPRRKPVTPVASPATIQLAPEPAAAADADEPAPSASQLDTDIGNILAGLSSFQSK